MTDHTDAIERLLATFWIHGNQDDSSDNHPETDLARFVYERDLDIADAVFEDAVSQLSIQFAGGSIEQWIVFVNFMGHPYISWNVMLDAVACATRDEHLDKIAAGPAEHLLAHYGSMLPLFEERAQLDPCFKRMLTGVWRHRMCDDVWKRLRVLQAGVPNPLPHMIPLEHGVEYMADTLSHHDRETADKGQYRRTHTGEWACPKPSSS